MGFLSVYNTEIWNVTCNVKNDDQNSTFFDFVKNDDQNPTFFDFVKKLVQ